MTQGNQKQLEDLILMHKLQDQLKFGGLKEKVEDIWAENRRLRDSLRPINETDRLIARPDLSAMLLNLNQLPSFFRPRIYS